MTHPYSVAHPMVLKNILVEFGLLEYIMEWVVVVVSDCELVDHRKICRVGVVTITGYLHTSANDIYHAEIVGIFGLANMPDIWIHKGRFLPRTGT